MQNFWLNVLISAHVEVIKTLWDYAKSRKNSAMAITKHLLQYNLSTTVQLIYYPKQVRQTIQKISDHLLAYSQHANY